MNVFDVCMPFGPPLAFCFFPSVCNFSQLKYTAIANNCKLLLICMGKSKGGKGRERKREIGTCLIRRDAI